MRLVSWNMGCSYGSSYKASQPRTWQQLLAWDPDLALVQETLHPPAWVSPECFIFTPYGWSRGATHEVGTLVYSRGGGLAPGPELQHQVLLGGQVTVAEVSLPDADVDLLLASIHADTRAVDAGLLVDEELDGVGGAHTTTIYPVDLIRHDLSALTPRRRFVLGGDLNVSIRFDDLYTKSSDMYGNVEWFTKAREAGWWNAHRKFHTGDQRTLFRPGKPEERFQIDHLFSDRTTWRELTRCDVIQVPFLDELTDHAPLVLEWTPDPAM